MIRNQLRFISGNLYSLKRDYGKPIDIYSKMTIFDYATGKQTVTRNKVRVRRAIVLPNIQGLRGKQVYEQAFLTGKPGYGSSFEVEDRTIILDKRDLPRGFTISTEDYLIIDPSTRDANRYEIKSISDYEYDTGLILGLKDAKGSQMFQIVDQYIRHKLHFDSVVTHE